MTNSLFLQNTEGILQNSVVTSKTDDSIASLLGLIGETVTTENATEMRLSNISGFYVTNILPDSPADKAYITKGNIIFEFNNEFVKDKSNFEKLLKKTHIGDRVNLTKFNPYSRSIDQVELDLVWESVNQADQDSTFVNGYYYEDFQTGLRIHYPPDFQALNCFYIYDCKYPLFNAGLYKILERGKTMKNILDQNINSKNESLIGFSLLNKTDNPNTGVHSIMYSNYDPEFGYIKGVEYFRKVNDKIFSFVYEGNDTTFSKNNLIVEKIVNRSEFFNTTRYYNHDFGISVLYPSSWKTLPVGMDSIKFSPPDSNEIYIDINMSKVSKGNDTHTSQCTVTDRSDDTLFDNALIVDRIPENRCPTISNIVDSIRVINSTSAQKLDEKYKGQITQPFEIKYNSTCWITQDLNDIFRGVTFYPNGCSLGDELYTSLTISYWNEKENGKSLADASLDDLTSLNENYKEVEMDKNTTELNPNNIKVNASSATYSFKDVNDGRYTDWIFYGTDDHKTNYRIEYFSTYDDYLNYWSTIKEMIKSVEVLNPVNKEDLPHGIRAGEAPSGTIFDNKTNLLYVVNSASKTISIINSTTNMEIDQIKVLTNPPPTGLALNQATDTLYVTHRDPIFVNSSIMSIIKNASTTRDVITKTINGNPFEVVINSKTGKVYVGDVDNDEITVLNGTLNEIARFKLSGSVVFPLPMGFGLANDEKANIIYAVDSKIGNVSLINGYTDDIIQNIPIRNNKEMGLENACVIDIAVDSDIDRAYVVDTTNCENYAGSYKGRLLVIDTINRKVIEKISLGANPNNVVVNPDTHRIYVTNQLNDSITIIEPVFHNTTELKVGAGPSDIAINPKTSIAYTTNTPSNSITMVDENRKKVVQSIDFSVVPSNAGVIRCSKMDYGTNNSHGLILHKDICESHPKGGFSFDSWSGNVKDLSSSVPTEGPSILQPFYSLLGMGNDASRLEIRSSGNLVANFRPAPPPIPPEYLTGLIGIAIAIFTGYLAPNIAQWINSFRQRKNMIKYYRRLDAIPKDSGYRKTLVTYKKDIIYGYSNGRISDKQYEILIEQISNLEKQDEEK